MKKGLAYKIIVWLYNIINKIGHNLNTAAKTLNVLKYKMDFGEYDDDIYIQTFPKSGTTLTQMLVYQMTTDGNMDFTHIYEVSPWLRNDAFKRNPIKKVPSPRIIKTHDPYTEFDKGVKGRFIYVYRNIYDVVISYYHQRKNYGNPNLEFDEFFENFLKSEKMNWFTFTKNWLENKYGFNILYLNYEELTTNLDACIPKIADFLNLDPSTLDMDRIKERCSFDFMKEHEDKFGEQPIERPEFVYNQFIRQGKAGEGKQQLSDKQQFILADLKKKTIGHLLPKKLNN